MPVAARTPFTLLIRHAERRLTSWSVESQLAARRNAMVASTALARRRAEREEVDDFFAALAAPVEPVVTAAPRVAARR